MKRHIIIDPEADQDLDNLFDYIASHNPDAARHVYLAVHRNFERLAEMPGIGVLRDYGEPRLASMRMWSISSFPNYLIFYIPTQTELQILRIIHGAQDIENIFRNNDLA